MYTIGYNPKKGKSKCTNHVANFSQKHVDFNFYSFISIIHLLSSKCNVLFCKFYPNVHPSNVGTLQGNANLLLPFPCMDVHIVHSALKVKKFVKNFEALLRSLLSSSVNNCFLLCDEKSLFKLMK